MENKLRKGFSGKYYFHSLYENVGTYIREPEPVPGYPSIQVYLVHSGGFWNISTDRKDHCFLWGNAGGLFRLQSKGLFNLHELYSEEFWRCLKRSIRCCWALNGTKLVVIDLFHAKQRSKFSVTKKNTTNIKMKIKMWILPIWMTNNSWIKINGSK